MAQQNSATAYSKRLCDDSKALREESKKAVTEAKVALARSRGLQALLASRRKMLRTPGA